MTVQLQNGVIVLAGDCPSGDAEDLLRHLLEEPVAAVDWRLCDTAHSAVIQILLAAGRAISGPPRGEFLRSTVESAISRAHRRIDPS
jgi:hypothetical protein